MREFLTSGQVGNIELNAQKKIREDVQNRWEQLGFVEGLEGNIKENIAMLYENEAKHLINEATASDNSGSFETVVFPIIRRVFSKLLANDIVSVQAMNLPVGKLFFILPVTSERTLDEGFLDENGLPVSGKTASHKGLMGYNRVNRNKNGEVDTRFYLPDEVVNVENTDENREARAGMVTDYLKKSLYDLFYDDFLYDNSKGKITIKVGAVEAVKFEMDGTMTSADTLTVNAIDGTVRNVILKVTGFSEFNKGKLTGPDGNEMDTESFLASLKVVVSSAITTNETAIGGLENGITSTFAIGDAVPFRVVTQRYGKGIVEYGSTVDAHGAIYLEIDLAKPCRVQGKTIDGYVGVDKNKVAANYFMVSWAQYDSLELETEMGEVSFKLDSVTVSVEERKLRATWSPELAQDVSAFHNIDAEAELTSILSEQIAAEIDREILRDLRKSAPWQARWDVNGWRRMAIVATNYTQKDWNQELFTKVNQISAQIHKATLRGGANFIVVSSEISALFDNLEYFHVSDASAEQDQYNMGIEKIGSLSSRYQVYRDPYAPHWSMIIGHKGKSLLDTGYIYAPYVPMQLTPTMYNPFNFAPVKGIMTRYAKKMVNNRYYGHVRVDGLTHWDTKELR